MRRSSNHSKRSRSGSFWVRCSLCSQFSITWNGCKGTKKSQRMPRTPDAFPSTGSGCIRSCLETNRSWTAQGEESSSSSVPHFRPRRVGPFGDELEAHGGTAVRALGSNGFFVEEFVFVGFEPHELKALR